MSEVGCRSSARYAQYDTLLFASGQNAGNVVVEAVTSVVAVLDCEASVFAAFQWTGDVSVDPECPTKHRGDMSAAISSDVIYCPAYHNV